MGECVMQAVRAEHLNHPLDVADPSAATDRLESLSDHLDIAERRAVDLGGESFEPAHARAVVAALILTEQEADPERVGERNPLELACGIQRQPCVPSAKRSLEPGQRVTLGSHRTWAVIEHMFADDSGPVKTRGRIAALRLV